MLDTRQFKALTSYEIGLASELKFLEGIEAGKTRLEKKYIETSNVTHFENIVSGLERFLDVQAVFQTFSIFDPDTDSVLKHTVDIVAKKGDQWVKVISRSAKGICMDWLTGSSRNIFEQADTYLHMAGLFRRNFSPPEVIFEFVAGVPDAIAAKLRSLGVTVIGEEIAIDTIAKIPEDFMELLLENEEEESARMLAGNVTSAQSPPVNLDVSAVFVLISNLTHEHGTDHKFDSTLLTQQAEMEKRNPARKQLLSQIEGRELIICRTAYDSVRDILSTVGGDSEKKRMEELFENVRLVDDAVSERASTLKHSDRINQRSMIIFGSGDHYRAVTATANKHFVSSAYHQGVSFDVILHESRALSEQKELPLPTQNES
ncbi:hypothetical protein KIN20_030806 [Parelaphostrongylus tenuis]|uniref:DUF1308 domain-containing protein n=1 Tax=Parelaphostrongylus tenuis TaxID=148309 RepID=A0AAD5WGQ7_PARTN|nr:hypothetical protein KIN20_030806 [Parelaphostrongylus tenuis]